jgi:uncharacterized protein YbjT (DUF2867 family)
MPDAPDSQPADGGPSLRGLRVLITGGAGFIGTKVAQRLVDDNEVVILDNLSRNSLAGTSIEDHPNLRLIVGDVLDERVVKESTGGADLVIHCAGIAGIDTVVGRPVQTMLVNKRGLRFAGVRLTRDRSECDWRGGRSPLDVRRQQAC